MSFDNKVYVKYEKELNDLINSKNINHFESSLVIEKKKIGEGGFGKIVLSQYKSLLIALKKIKHNNPKHIISEILIQKRYCHPMIPGFYGVVLHPDFYTNLIKFNSKLLVNQSHSNLEVSSPDFDLCFEYVNGFSLEYILRSKKLNEIEKLIILLNLATVLEYIHGFNLIHRDLKPENIMIDKTFEFRLLDFGISRVGGEDKYANTVSIGTLMYMAPENFDLVATVQESDEEELEGNKIDDNEDENNDEVSRISDKVDVWAFGCILHEMFTGIKPWSNKVKTDKKILALLYSKKPFEIDKNLDKSSKITKLIKRCMVVNPILRASIKEVKTLLLEIFYDKIKIELNLDSKNINVAEITLKIYSLFPQLEIKERHNIIKNIQSYIFDYLRNLSNSHKGIPRFLQDYFKQDSSKKNVAKLFNAMLIKEIDDSVQKEKKEQILKKKIEKNKEEILKKQIADKKLRKNGKQLLKVTWDPETYFIVQTKKKLDSPKMSGNSAFTIDSRKLKIHRNQTINNSIKCVENSSKTKDYVFIEKEDDEKNNIKFKNSIHRGCSLISPDPLKLPFYKKMVELKNSIELNPENHKSSIIEKLGNEIIKQEKIIKEEKEKAFINEKIVSPLQKKKKHQENEPIIPILSNPINNQTKKNYMKRTIEKLKKRKEQRQEIIIFNNRNDNLANNDKSKGLFENILQISNSNNHRNLTKKLIINSNSLADDKENNLSNHVDDMKSKLSENEFINRLNLKYPNTNNDIFNIDITTSDDVIKFRYDYHEVSPISQINIFIDKDSKNKFISANDKKSKLFSKIKKLNIFNENETEKIKINEKSNSKLKILPEKSSYLMKLSIENAIEYDHNSKISLKGQKSVKIQTEDKVTNYAHFNENLHTNGPLDEKSQINNLLNENQHSIDQSSIENSLNIDHIGPINEKTKNKSPSNDYLHTYLPTNIIQSDLPINNIFHSYSQEKLEKLPLIKQNTEKKTIDKSQRSITTKKKLPNIINRNSSHNKIMSANQSSFKLEQSSDRIIDRGMSRLNSIDFKFPERDELEINYNREYYNFYKFRNKMNHLLYSSNLINMENSKNVSPSHKNFYNIIKTKVKSIKSSKKLKELSRSNNKKLMSNLNEELSKKFSHINNYKDFNYYSSIAKNNNKGLNLLELNIDSRKKNKINMDSDKSNILKGSLSLPRINY